MESLEGTRSSLQQPGDFEQGKSTVFGLQARESPQLLKPTQKAELLLVKMRWFQVLCSCIHSS